MKNTAFLLCAFCVLGSHFDASGEDIIYSSGGFEPPAFQPGSLRGQDQWEVLKGGGGLITTEPVGDGLQALALNSHSGESSIRLEMRVAEPHQVTFLLRPYGGRGPGVAAELYIRGIDSTHNTFIIQSFSLRGRRPIPDGEKVHENLGLFEDEWRRVLIKVDPFEGKFSLYIDDSPVVESAPVESERRVAQVYSYEFLVRGEPEVDAGIIIDNFQITSGHAD